jgi:pimeloyl-ACP methyl ester carboxylesterase
MPGSRAVRPSPRGEFIALGDRRLHVVRAGPERQGPLVLLEAGSFGFSVDWTVVQAQLAAKGLRSLAYDRAGMGLSDAGPGPRDGLAIARDLEALLAALDETGPLTLVGHSMAGLHVCLFAGRNRERVTGLVLVDAVTPWMAERARARRVAALYQRFAAGAAVAARASLLKPFSVLGDTIGLEGDAARHKRWAFADAAHNRTSAEEVARWPACVAQALAAGPLDQTWPVAVITAGGRLPQRDQMIAGAAPAATEAWVRNLPDARHATLLGPRFAHVIVEGVEHVLKPRALGDS